MEMERLWGKYEIIWNVTGYKVKRLVVNPGRQTSIQRHLRRSEHWVVVSGIGDFGVGAAPTMPAWELRWNRVKVDAETYVPVGYWHCIANRGTSPLVLIEVQIGDICSEEDIERWAQS